LPLGPENRLHYDAEALIEYKRKTALKSFSGLSLVPKNALRLGLAALWAGEPIVVKQNFPDLVF